MRQLGQMIQEGAYTAVPYWTNLHKTCAPYTYIDFLVCSLNTIADLFVLFRNTLKVALFCVFVYFRDRAGEGDTEDLVWKLKM